MRITCSSILLILTSVLLSCSSDPLTGLGADPDYPTTIRPLSDQDLDDLKQEFAQANPGFCSSLNEYGFTYGRCSMGLRGLPSNPVDELVQIARDAISNNSRFTGVEDTDGLMFHHTGGSLRRIRVHFYDQQYEGLLVEGTYMSVDMDSLGVLSIHGNHYPDIYIPNPRVLSRTAQFALLGTEITWYGTGGNPHTFIVTWDHLQEEPTRVVLPANTDNGIELRVTWRVQIGFGWAGYVDTMTKEVLGIRQFFIT